MKKQYALFFGIFSLVFSAHLLAYSYAEKGKEPVIEGREAMLQVLNTNDVKVLKQALSSFEKELVFLDQSNQVHLLPAFNLAIEQKDNDSLIRLLDQTAYQVIVSRLNNAFTSLSNHQVAKVLVVKTKLFLDLLAPKLQAKQRENAMQAINKLLESVGNPGVFGVGKKPADPDAFKQAETQVLEALQQFQ